MTEGHRRPWDVVLFTSGMVLFAVCAHRPDLLAPRLLGMAMAVGGLAAGVATDASVRRLFGAGRVGDLQLLWAAAGVGLGAALGIAFRFRYDLGVVPLRLTSFCLVAAGIGVCEEVAFRGYVQGRLRGYGGWRAAMGGAASHTAYKVGLFILPIAGAQVDLVWLGALTFVVGAVFGLVREKSASLIPPVLAHVAFDVIAYGDAAQWPWWV